jgi:hypothetical protein
VYPNFDVALGVQQLQLMGVRYYMAASPETVRQASENPNLTEVTIGSAGPWRVFMVEDSELVQPLTHEPVVYSNVEENQKSWLSPAVEFFNNPDQWNVLRAASGPAEWQRWDACLPADEAPATATDDDRSDCDPPETPLGPVQVSNITWDDDEVTFDVDQTGVPVLVKVSYFPNWKVAGGDGPYRVTPNLMVVVPTANHVRLHYGATGIDHLSNVITLLGLVALVFLFRAKVEQQQRPIWDPVGRLFRVRRTSAASSVPAAADAATAAMVPYDDRVPYIDPSAHDANGAQADQGGARGDSAIDRGASGSRLE